MAVPLIWVALSGKASLPSGDVQDHQTAPGSLLLLLCLVLGLTVGAKDRDLYHGEAFAPCGSG